MDPTFSDEQDEFRSAVRRALAQQARTGEPPHPEDDARVLTILLALGAGELPTETDRGIVFEELGASCVTGPASAVLGLTLPVLDALEDGASIASDCRSGRILPIVVDDLTLAHDVGNATHLLVISGGDVGIIARSDATVEPLESFDPGRPLSAIALQTSPDRIGSASAARMALDRAGRMAITYELVGIARACVDIAVEHARDREQFGRPIGSYQAISHRCVDMFMSLESARNHAHFASWALDAGDTQAELATRRAHAEACRAALSNAQSVLQVLGGIGFTWEHDAHRYLRRAHTCSHAMGTMRDSLARVSALIGLEG
jgi:hypothetical protein